MIRFTHHQKLETRKQKLAVSGWNLVPSSYFLASVADWKEAAHA